MSCDATPGICALVFIVLDVFTGFLNAAMEKQLSSHVMREGLFHKATYLVLIVLFSVVEYAQVHFEFMAELPTVLMVCVYICATELISILENLIKINPNLASWKIFDAILSLTDAS